MPTHLPTRRAVRPDSQHYRMSRRQGLRRRSKSHIARDVALAVVVIAIVALVWWLMHRGRH